MKRPPKPNFRRQNRRVKPPTKPQAKKRKQAAGASQPTGAIPAPVGLPAPNTTWDFYIDPNVPPTAPNQQAVRIHLDAEFQGGSEGGEGDQNFRWTHVAYCAAAEDVRDTYPSMPANKVFIPDKNGTPFLVVFVELVNRNTPQKFKRVFLKRDTVNWPSDDL